MQDIFVEVGYLSSSTGYVNGEGSVPAHSHLPSKAALDSVANALQRAAPRPTISGPIAIHFDVGNHYQAPAIDPSTGLPYPALPSLATCQNLATWVPSCAIIPAHLARGGEEIEETACVPDGDVTCHFPLYPGTVGWKNGFNGYRDEPLNYPDEPQCVAAGAGCVRRFDRNRMRLFRYALFAHALGIPRAGAPGTPRNVSGIGDGGAGGGDFMVTLGFWDGFRGTPFVKASTILHELGHTIGLRHGGAPFQPNCRPNYQSVMNYLFQIRGLVDADGVPVVDYSRQVLSALDETNLSEPAGLGPMTYRTRWYAPLDSAFVEKMLGTTPATKRCDGTPLAPGDVPMVRVEGTHTSGAIDWIADGDTDDTAFAQDISFASGIAPLGSGHNDFQSMDLRQVGSRRNAGSGRLGGGLSLQVGFGDLGFGDLGFGDLGFGDLGAPVGDLDFETVEALGQAPDGLALTVTPGAIELDWSGSHASDVTFYEVYRVDGATITPTNFASRTLLATVFPPTSRFVDRSSLSPGSYTYFIIATTWRNSHPGTSVSGPSNLVTVTVQ